MCPAREVPPQGGTAKRQGCPFLGVQNNFLKIFIDTFFARSKESIQRKGAQQLGLRLSSRRARTRGRQELIPFLTGLRQLAALIPRPQPSLGCAAMGFKTLETKEKKQTAYL
jgi:hypothetical protein